LFAASAYSLIEDPHRSIAFLVGCGVQTNSNKMEGTIKSAIGTHVRIEYAMHARFKKNNSALLLNVIY